MRTAHRSHRSTPPRSAFAGFRFPADVIVLAVRWYLRFGLSYRDVEELLTERGVEVDHVTIHRWVLRFTPLLADAARPCRHAVGSRWQVDETYVKVAGRWRYVYRAIDQFSQVIDVFVSARRDATAARRFFDQAISATRVTPIEVSTDQAPVYPAVLGELLPARAQAGPQPQSDRRWACIHAERSTWTLRASGRGASELASCRGGRRTGLGDLIPEEAIASARPASGATQQRRSNPSAGSIYLVSGYQTTRAYLGGSGGGSLCT
jgi:transposase-like protein